jgi:hypothetical protein
MIWLILVVIIVVVLAVLILSSRNSPSDAANYQTMVELYAIRRRGEVAQFKTGVRRDAADARRALRVELDKQSRRK